MPDVLDRLRERPWFFAEQGRVIAAMEAQEERIRELTNALDDGHGDQLSGHHIKEIREAGRCSDEDFETLCDLALRGRGLRIIAKTADEHIGKAGREIERLREALERAAVMTTSAPFQPDRMLCRICNASCKAAWGKEALDHAPDCALAEGEGE